MDEKKYPLPQDFTEVVIKHKSKGELIPPDTEFMEKKRTPTKNCALYCLLPTIIFILVCSAVYCMMSFEAKTPNIIKIETEEFQAKPFMQPKYTEPSLKDTPPSNIRKNINLQVILNGEPAINKNFDGKDNLTEISINIAKPDVEFQFLNDLSNQNRNKEKIDDFDLSQSKEGITDFSKPIVKVIDTYEIRKIPIVNSSSMLKTHNNFPFIDNFLDSIFGFSPRFNSNENSDSPTTTKVIEVSKVKKDKKNTTLASKNSNNDNQAFPHSIFKDFDNIFDTIVENKIPSTTIYRNKPIKKSEKLESIEPIFDIVSFNNKPFSNPFFNSFQKPQSDKYKQNESKESDESMNKLINSILGIPTKSKWQGKGSHATQYNEYNKESNKGYPRGFDVEIPNIVFYENTFTHPCHIFGGKCPLKHKNSQISKRPVSFLKNENNIESKEAKEVSTIATTEAPITNIPTTKQEISSPSPTLQPTTKQISSSIENNNF